MNRTTSLASTSCLMRSMAWIRPTWHVPFNGGQGSASTKLSRACTCAVQAVSGARGLERQRVQRAADIAAQRRIDQLMLLRRGSMPRKASENHLGAVMVAVADEIGDVISRPAWRLDHAVRFRWFHGHGGFLECSARLCRAGHIGRHPVFVRLQAIPAPDHRHRRRASRKVKSPPVSPRRGTGDARRLRAAARIAPALSAGAVSR